jgi:hypothetical protein
MKQGLRTIHDHFHVIDKSVDHFHGLSGGHPALLLCKTVESFQHSLDLAFS